MNSAQRNLGGRAVPPVPHEPQPRLRLPPLSLVPLLLALALTSLMVCQPALSQSADEEGLERKVKAAFLYRFTAYAEWPPATLPAGDSPVVIGVLGADEVAAELTQIVRGRSVGSHPLTVR